ncbi:MAG: helix-turn-helix transcriptional regulator [Sporolactobacillus sp.]
MEQRKIETPPVPKAKKIWEKYLHENSDSLKHQATICSPEEKIIDNFTHDFIQLRKQHLLNQEDMAHLLSENRSKISRIESGNTQVPLAILAKLAAKMNLAIIITPNNCLFKALDESYKR